MKKQANPALEYRATVRSINRSYRSALHENDETNFQLWLRSYREDARESLTNPSQDSKMNAESAKMNLFVSSVGLLTYGELDSVSVILDNIPDSPRNIQQLALIVKAMLPLPQELNPLQDRNAVKRWFNTHKRQLIWMENEGVFVLNAP